MSGSDFFRSDRALKRRDWHDVKRRELAPRVRERTRVDTGTGGPGGVKPISVVDYRSNEREIGKMRSANQGTNDTGGALMSKIHTSPEDFIRAWQTSNDVSEVAKKLKLSTESTIFRLLSCRAYYLRKRGVPLKKFAPGGSRWDIEALAELAETLLNEPGGSE